MKFKILCGVLFFLITGLSVQADCEKYIVKLNIPIQTYSEGASTFDREFALVTYEELEELSDMGMVEYYEPDCPVKLFDDYSSKTTDYTSWNLSAINVEKAWDIGCYGNDIKVGVIDSGIYHHPDLKNNISEGYNYTDNSTDTTDNIGHGTYVSGIIAAECNNSYITGIAHQVKIVPLKCFDNNFEPTAFVIADAIYDAVEIYDCDVINMSFGMVEKLTNTTLKRSIANAVQNGCIVVSSVGNDGLTKEYYPAKYPDVIGVGAINNQMNLSWFSQRNSTVDVVAPGEGVSSVSIDGYEEDSGTSFSAPHVSAAAAIAKCIDKEITAQEFTELIKATSTACAGDYITGYDTYYGYGLINIKNIVDEMLKDTPVFLSPITNKTLKLYNNSDEKLTAGLIMADYENKSFLNAEFYDILLNPGGIKEIFLSFYGVQTKIMLWDSKEKLKPLLPAKLQ